MTWRMVNQLDGTENQRNNCVPACISMLVWNQAGVYLSPDSLKDATYGQGYLGGQAASKYTGVCASHGVSLIPFNGAPTALVAEMKSALLAGKYVIFTIPTNWAANVNTGSSHVMIAHGLAGNDFVIADPWNGVARTWSADYMAPRLRFNQIWEGLAVATNDLAAKGWHDTANYDPAVFEGILTDPTGKVAGKGMRGFMLRNNWNGDNWILRQEYPADPVEPGNPHWAGARMDFRGMNGPTSLGYVDHDIPNGPAKGVYAIWAGQDIIALEQELAKANATLAAIKAALGG